MEFLSDVDGGAPPLSPVKTRWQTADAILNCGCGKKGAGKVTECEMDGSAMMAGWKWTSRNKPPHRLTERHSPVQSRWRSQATVARDVTKPSSVQEPPLFHPSV